MIAGAVALAALGHSPRHSAPESVVAAILEVEARARRREAPASIGAASSPA
jgi:hypothetical protein